MSKTHTPTPWIRDDSSKLECDVRGENRRRVALCFGLESTSEPWTKEYKSECRANADLIVTAVNHHQELITRLYNLKNAIEGIDTKLVILRLKEADETLKKVIQ